VSIVALHKPKPCEDVVATLRRIADDIENDEVGWPVTTAVLVLGHTEAEVSVGGDLVQENHWETFGAGPRCDAYTVRGLLLTAATRWAND
jgi:hypothetical protein